MPVEVQSLVAYQNSESEESRAFDAAKRPKVWAALARKMGPQALRMNLNTLLRQGVFDQQEGDSLRFSTG